MEPAVVFQTSDPAEAHLVCSRLRAADILAAVNHEFSAFNAPFTGAGGGIRVEVPASQADDARTLLAEHG